MSSEYFAVKLIRGKWFACQLCITTLCSSTHHMMLFRNWQHLDVLTCIWILKNEKLTCQKSFFFNLDLSLTILWLFCSNRNICDWDRTSQGVQHRWHCSDRKSTESVDGIAAKLWWNTSRQNGERQLCYSNCSLKISTCYKGTVCFHRGKGAYWEIIGRHGCICR